MPISVIHRSQMIVSIGFSIILILICVCLYLNSEKRITVYLNQNSQCVIAHNGDKYIRCEELRSLDVEYMLNHYKIYKYTNPNEVQE